MHSQDNSREGEESQCIADHTNYLLRLRYFFFWTCSFFIKLQLYQGREGGNDTSKRSLKHTLHPHSISCLIAAMLTVDFDRWTPDQRAGGETRQHHGSRHLVHVHFLLRPSVKTEKKRTILLSVFGSQYIITHWERVIVRWETCCVFHKQM